jgi:hypothetical protein
MGTMAEARKILERKYRFLYVGAFNIETNLLK